MLAICTLAMEPSFAITRADIIQSMRNLLTRITINFLLGIGTFFFYSYAVTCEGKNVRIDKLTFTNTQTWSPRFLYWAENAVSVPEITLPASPKNTSNNTKEDLTLMHAYQDTRTEENIEEIKREINIYDAMFGQKSFAQLVDESSRPHTFELMKDVIELESPQIMKQKKIYNRVRPSYLDSTLKPVIDIPPHPAYPSGHATQAHLRALVLSELDPKHRDDYLQSAKRIARNREVAGVHYPGDSKAGVILAEQLFTKLMNNSDFAEHLKEAKKEW